MTEVTVNRWDPTLLEVASGIQTVLSDRLPSGYVDALLVHGSPVRDDELDERLLKSVRKRYAYAVPGEVRIPGVVSFVLNGLTREACEAKNIAYRGYESWQEYLETNHVYPQDILLLPPSGHTAAESRNYLLLAKELGWNKLAIASQAYHQTRCFLQIIALMDEVEYWPAVYNAPAPDISWDYAMMKPVMKTGTVFTEDVDGTLSDHIKGELDRIIRYAQPPRLKADGTPEYTRHATIPEMLAYLERRESLAGNSA